MGYDLVIRNGRSSTDPEDPASGAISASSMGASSRSAASATTGAQEIDAEGQMVAPGFIDGHTHLDAQVFWDPLGTSRVLARRHLGGHGQLRLHPGPLRRGQGRPGAPQPGAGRGHQPGGPPGRHPVAVGDLPASISTPSSRVPKGINYAGYIGHSALRTYVMGERAFEEKATEDDLRAMRREVRQALEPAPSASPPPDPPTTGPPTTARSPAGRPSWAEVQALVGTMGDLGAGMFQLANEQHRRPGRDRRLPPPAARPGRGQRPAHGVHRGLRPPDPDAAPAVPGPARRLRPRRRSHRRPGPQPPIPVGARVSRWACPSTSSRAGKRSAATRSTSSSGCSPTPDQRARLVAEALDASYRSAIGAELRPPDYDAIRVIGSVASTTRPSPISLPTGG